MSLKIALAAALIATPLMASSAFAAKAKVETPVDDGHTGPIPYSELAAADAKLNGPEHKVAVKHHAKAKKADAAAAAPAAAPAK